MSNTARGGRPHGRTQRQSRRATPLRVARRENRRAAYEAKYAAATSDFQRFWLAVDYLRGAWRSNPDALTGSALADATRQLERLADGIYTSAAREANTKHRTEVAA